MHHSTAEQDIKFLRKSSTRSCLQAHWEETLFERQAAMLPRYDDHSDVTVLHSIADSRAKPSAASA
jgi:hypothetical protein